jgi:hypothetical protein
MTKAGKKHTFSKSDLIDKLIDLRINKGYTRLSLLEFLTKELEYSQSYSYELIQAASKEFDDRAIQNFGEDLKEDIERFESLYEKAIISNNSKEARELLKEISKLKGHYKERIEISGEMSIKNIEIVIKTNESEDTSN